MEMHEINDLLMKAPAEIYKQGEGAEESRLLYKEEELKLKALEAKSHLSVKAENPDMTVGDLRAKVDEVVEQQRLDVVTMESAYRKALLKHEFWINRFTAARKAASLKIEEVRSGLDTVSKQKED